jgi:hypothetical protein
VSGPPYAGGCLCGQVRWRAVAAPMNVRICHCTLCQRWTGGPFFARALFARGDVDWSGETTAWPTSAHMLRRSCARCGTPLFADPDNDPPRLGVSLASMDEPDALAPECHIFVSTRRAWAPPDDGLPQFPERPA